MDLQLVKGNVVVPPALRDRLILVNGQVLEYGEPDQLFLNDGHGNFKSASWTGGRFVDEDGHRLKHPPSTGLSRRLFAISTETARRYLRVQ